VISSDQVKKGLRVLIVDDHPLIRIGIAATIDAQSNMEVVGEAGSASEAIRLFELLQPDLILMDLRLPDASGVTAIRKIMSIAPQAKIIVLTTYEGDEDIHQALSAGAKGYLIKGLSHGSLIQAIVRVQAGQRYLPPLVSNTLSSRTPSTVLTEREQEVLRHMFAGESNPEIASALLIRETTVKTHVSAILIKLDVDDRVQAVVEALRRGLIHL
jgi:DNA-binding NarL/FixJ family response regulator